MGKITQMVYQLVLITDAHEWEEEGWRMATGQVATKLGDWASVWMVKAIA